jgi:hypothetical protein
MILEVHSDASYLSEPKARSRAGGHFSFPSNTTRLQSPFHVTSTIINHIVASATEAELAALFINTQQILILRNILAKLQHTQPPTPIITDNKVSHGLLRNTMKPRKSKSMDMRYFWIRDHINREIVNLIWLPGNINKADYVTKHHPPSHHRNIRPTYLIH